MFLRWCRQEWRSLRSTIKDTLLDRLPGVIRRGPTAGKRVALTFDDGPDHLTPEYLRVLDELGVSATFFLIGRSATQHPELVREYVRRGHHVAGHGYDHTRFTKLSLHSLLVQCVRTNQAIGARGREPWVRPPHGSIGPASLLALRQSGHIVALWSIDSCDYRDRDVESLIERCSPQHVSPGDVLLFHEGQEWTLQALPRIVAGLRASGFECVTMQDLVARPLPTRASQRSWWRATLAGSTSR